MNSIFDSTKLKLTALYLAIIMFVTIAFSFFIFSGVNQATERALEVQRVRMERQFSQVPPEFRIKVLFDPFKAEAMFEIRERVFYNLIVINIAVFVISGTLGYYLAGKTLKPIEDMITKQKRFISDAAHELKTPLTAIKTDLEVTLRDKNLTFDESKKTLKRTVDEIDELSLLAGNLLASSKYNNSDIYRKDLAIVSVKGIAEKVIKKFHAQSKDKNIEITKDLQDVKINSDSQEIEHVLTNLLDNAIKYSESGTKVHVSLSELNNVIELKVKDQGIGITEQNLEQIFEPFFRVDKSRAKSKAEGYGLGLAITKDIVESYGGTIEVKSHPNKGSTFIVSIPTTNN